MSIGITGSSGGEKDLNTPPLPSMFLISLTVPGDAPAFLNASDGEYPTPLGPLL
ncbi:MAG: hypothetical protein GW779_03765 [Candidatus Altiarchaeum hamiconexum]|uniref:Uncharacterized protein n=1 Tax=Candidatus Altarchaeum hamiconexum TaxID=1803513 RepID=A0A8J7YZN0_9ARCH|nr:hypothetical protein [Candidatus Altarchaeum hamiconexum]NCN69089.1 hypothetical protein [Candidatus Altarchaeum hamiconexum]NCS91512.1 hypothetical protein [Candidatus Altarchaeum hamiconexum]NCT00815.1 hypothetical protein [Candidatus Altarchaeum hamiconexum]